MRSRIQNRFLALFAALAVFTAPMHASGAVKRATPDEAVALVKKGVEFYKKNGKEKSLAAFNDTQGQFVKGELYLFVYSANGDGIVLAHGQNQKMVGKQLLDMRDPDGVYINRELNKIANSPAGKGWLNYRWPNSVTKAVEAKRSYVERVGDIWIGCGIYGAW